MSYTPTEHTFMDKFKAIPASSVFGNESDNFFVVLHNKEELYELAAGWNMFVENPPDEIPEPDRYPALLVFADEYPGDVWYGGTLEEILEDCIDEFNLIRRFHNCLDHYTVTKEFVGEEALKRHMFDNLSYIARQLHMILGIQGRSQAWGGIPDVAEEIRGLAERLDESWETLQWPDSILENYVMRAYDTLGQVTEGRLQFDGEVGTLPGDLIQAMREVEAANADEYNGGTTLILRCEDSDSLNFDKGCLYPSYDGRLMDKYNHEYLLFDETSEGPIPADTVDSVNLYFERDGSETRFSLLAEIPQQ